MGYTDIIQRIKSDVEAVTGIGLVYDYKRHVHDDHKKKKLLTTGGKQHVWFLYRDGQPTTSDYLTLQLPYDSFVIEGWYALDDSVSTETTFQSLINNIRNAVNNDRLLGGHGYVYEPCDIETIDEDMLVDTLCHHVRLETVIQTTVETGALDMTYTDTETVLTSSARTTSGNSSALTVSKYYEGNFLISVTAASGTGRKLNVYAKISDDDSTYYPHGEPVAIVETGQYSLPTSNFGTYIKFYYDISGPSASFTLAVVFEGKNPYGL